MTMPTTRRRFAFLMVGSTWATLQAGPCAAAARVRVEGQWFEPNVRVAGIDLLLNGTGVRAVAWFKGYAAGLYLSARVSSAPEVLALPGPKRLQLRMLHDVPAAEFVRALNKGVERNAATSEMPSLGTRLAQFDEQITQLGKVRVGDVVDLDHEPGRGLVMRVNGTLRGSVLAGDDFFAAVLRAFVGEHPYDEKLKAGLLGRLS